MFTLAAFSDEISPDPVQVAQHLDLLCRWEEQLRAFRDDGYEGCISLETHVNPDRFPGHLEARYGRFLRGERRGAASTVCLAWLRDRTGTLA